MTPPWQKLQRQASRAPIVSQPATARPLLLDDVESRREGPAEENDVANLEARVTALEGQTDRQDSAIDGLRAEIALMRSEMATRTDIADVRREMADLRREMGDLRTEVNRRIDLLNAKVDRQFVWLTGIMVTGFVTMIGAVIGVMFRVNSGG